MQRSAIRPVARNHKPYAWAALQRVFHGGGQQRDVLHRNHAAEPAYR